LPSDASSVFGFSAVCTDIGTSPNWSKPFRLCPISYCTAKAAGPRAMFSSMICDACRFSSAARSGVAVSGTCRSGNRGSAESISS
jgi:Rieske Fe-S protein